MKSKLPPHGSHSKISRITCTPIVIVWLIRTTRRHGRQGRPIRLYRRCILLLRAPARCSSIPASRFVHPAAQPDRSILWLPGRLQLSTIIRDLSLHCRAAKIAGCRLRGQEIVAATATDRVSLARRRRHCSLVARRCVKTLLTSTPMTTCMTSRVETCRCSASPSSNYRLTTV